MDTAEQVGQDRDGGQGDQDGADHMTGDPAGDGQQQGAGAVHHLLQVEGHAAGRSEGVERESDSSTDVNRMVSMKIRF